jgi:uncharacterized membrane protein HdeD (DUF308 family)
MKTSSTVSLALSGVLLVVLGVVCICNPFETLFASAWIIGIMTLFSGMAMLLFTLETQIFLPNSGTRMLSALLQIFFGLFFLTHKGTLTLSLPIVFSAWVLIEGIILAVNSFDFKKAGFGAWWCIFLLGLASAVLGFFGLRNPEVAGKTLSTLIGLAVILCGLAHFVGLAGAKKFEHLITGR